MKCSDENHENYLVKGLPISKPLSYPACPFTDVMLIGVDAWASMPSGLILSVIVTLLACAATWIGFTNLRSGGEA